MTAEVSKKEKYLIIQNSIERLIQKIESLEYLVIRLKDGSIPEDCKTIETPTPSFSAVYDSLSSVIDVLGSRIQKATEELQTLLLE